MKVNKKNLFHYLYYFGILIAFIFGYLISLFLYKKKRVVCTAPKINPNISIIYQHLKANGFNVLYLSISHSEYKKLRDQDKNTLFVMNPLHWSKIFSSKLIISSHTIIFHSFINFFTKIKTICCGHGIRTADNKNNVSHFKRTYYKFDEFWLFSNFERDIYKKLGYSKNNTYVTGYPVTSKLSEFNNKNNFQKNILIAPTSYEFKSKSNSKFDLDNIQFLKFLDDLANNFQYKITIKPHWKSKLKKSSISFIKNQKNLYFVNNDEINNYLELITSQDLLVTDWSSIYVDFLSLNKPIIFLENEMPKTVSKFTEVFDNEIIKRVESYSEFKNQIVEYVFKTDFKNLEEKIFDNLDKSNIINNIVLRIEKVLNDYK